MAESIDSCNAPYRVGGATPPRRRTTEDRRPASALGSIREPSGPRPRETSSILGRSSMISNPDLLAAIAAAERPDPTRSAIHALLAAAWCFFLVSSRSVEAALFVALILITILRFREIVPCWWAAIRTVPAAALVSWLVLVTIVTLAAGTTDSIWDSLPRRQFLVPLFLIPVVHRWRLLLISAHVASVGVRVRRGPAAG